MYSYALYMYMYMYMYVYLDHTSDGFCHRRGSLT